MTTHLRTKGLSRRAYARQRGCSEAAVRQAIADGRLKPALLPDGSLDAETADELLSKSTVAGKEPPSELSQARQRKLRAQCALLQDEVERLEKSLLPTAEVATATKAMCRHIADRLRVLLEEIIPAAVDVEPLAANHIVQQATYRAMDQIAGTKIVSTVKRAAEPRRRSLEAMDATELAALKATLQARRMEIHSGQRDGVLMLKDEVGRDLVRRLSASRAKLLALPHKAAPRLNLVSTVEAKRVLEPLMAEVIEALAGGAVSIEDLLPMPKRQRIQRKAA